ncbi:MAG TPA: papain-like cysteine protease family protein [Bacillota bacterium]|nr:papain-like cysteine protease family protein [Bacillota bacterium]
MKLNKALVILMALVLVFALVSCGGNGTEEGDTTPYEKHVLSYPDSIDPFADGASSYDSMGDHFDSPYFKILDVYNMEPTDTLSIIPHFMTYQQSTEYSCGAVSSLLVLNYYGVTDYNEQDICQLGSVSDETGVGVTGVSQFFNGIGWNVVTNRDGTIDFDPYADLDDPNSFITWVRSHLDDGIPIMVDWLDWAGHWQVIIGYDTMGTEDHFGDDVIIVADPYDTSDHYQDGYFIIPAERFFYMWREGVHTTAEPEYFPWVIATPPEE